MWAGTAAEYRTHVRGPAFVTAAPDAATMTAALIAAAVWNQYLPALSPKFFNVSSANLPGNIVGEIWIPCPQNHCNVTIDPSYSAPINVLIHEFGHGLGLPPGAVSGTGLTVDDGNHWAPQHLDPREIMTATIDASPKLSRYTLAAMDPQQNRACYETYECPPSLICYATGVLEAPGMCDYPGRTLINPYHYPDYGLSLFLSAIFLTVLIVMTVMLCEVPRSPTPSHVWA